ncbi:hypothetical protein H6G54_24310 [Anabaena cylindrica FACHB-243]|uniref:Uncharacterized protein n=1 Tax=Anabaena cylindrica (strain ATCC 27899 / PCC 7122) TaxID=272123 RepID=K9ZHE1_ANACC|nr:MULTISPECIES: hypothetical protein [Anabaena]AFZ57987.1 hypothetical protein Anacy_2543 [Anabaena cylindrica PCC 7122]MBD2420767.1 hypothetical protein [Anabaena cylindrica FACHB-243]MBY5282718.1 demethoxyubiquinone hydroxylase family protein [Anabaena sp. CCAP 1446/1C]MBY5311179.1 demethoxyubiquinone hydroxylase family protein [Anabaena sp. CCAP 1446/1C]MCM2408213.1 hypothetical protein [Anabaena sp. CCAP 1446/1C]
MSVNKKAAIAFIEVIENQSDLITDQIRQDLDQLSDQLPEDDEDIVEKIENWLQSYPLLLQTYKQNLQSMDLSLTEDGDIGPGGAKSPTPPNQPSESSKELIQNAIKENSPLSDDKKSQPKP